MPDVLEIIDGGSLLPTDQLLVVRGPAVVGITFAELLNQVQAAVSLPGPALLGRPSASTGSPQTVGLGAGVAIGGGALQANARDHATLALLGAIDLQAEVIVNSGGIPARLPLPLIISFVLAQAGVSLTVPPGTSMDFSNPANSGLIPTL